LIISSVQEQEWDFFEHPDTSLYVNDAEYRAELAPYLKPPSEPSDLFSFLNWVRDVAERRKEILAKRAAHLARSDGSRARITDIWRGDEPGDTPIVVIYRNDDNAYVGDPNVAIGDFPKTAWVLDLPILEMMMYNGSVINFDQFGAIGPWLAIREGFGLMRRVAESNFLRFLPADKRRAIYESWYQGELSDLRREKELDLGPDVTVPAALQFKTDDPKREFLAMLLEHIGNSVKTADPINRPQPGDNPDRVTKTLQTIVAAANQQQPMWRKFKAMLPQATFLRIDAPGRDPLVYTMTHDRDYETKAFALSLLEKPDPAKIKVTIYPGILTAYPNFIFRITESDIEEFASKLTNAETPEQFTAVVERWGVRRSHPDFWEVVHSITDYVRRKNPLEAAMFDVNRYKNL
jgi:hypothetical protein